MKDFKVLKFLDRFRGLFQRLGVDYGMMRRILQVKLIMDGRRVPTVLSGSEKKKEENNGFIKSLWIYALMGAVTVPFLLAAGSYAFQMSMVFGILIFMVMSSLISDFSSVLLDLRDKNIIYSRPVDRRTISAAKLTHVMIYMFWLTASFAAIPLAVSLYRNGVLFFLIFLAEIILADLFIVALTALIYLLILKFFDGETLRDIINYVQIALALAVTVGYQFVGRLFSVTLGGVEFAPRWWQVLVVPVWFGAPFEVFLRGAANVHFIILTLLVVLAPVLSIILYIRLMPAFEQNLQKLNSYSGSRRKKRGKLSERISRAICFSREERLFFRFASDMMKNEREFKLKIYPMLGLSMVMPFIILFNTITVGGPADLHGSRLYLCLYFCGMFLPTFLIMSRCSSNHKGAWIYKTIPLTGASPIFRGTVKALIVNLFLPVFCVESVIFLFVFGMGVFPGLVAVLLNLLLYAAVSFKILKPVLPFSEAFGIKQDDEWMGLVLLIALGVLAGVQFISSLSWLGIYIDIGAAAIANIIMWKKAFHVSGII
ncbi:MAG TPA: hypothetical protein PKA19_00685 [Bacillota bacterium]|nr:hypothetical protein [Bacillota bacterium]